MSLQLLVTFGLIWLTGFVISGIVFPTIWKLGYNDPISLFRCAKLIFWPVWLLWSLCKLIVWFGGKLFSVQFRMLTFLAMTLLIHWSLHSSFQYRTIVGFVALMVLYLLSTDTLARLVEAQKIDPQIETAQAKELPISESREQIQTPSDEQPEKIDWQAKVWQQPDGTMNTPQLFEDIARPKNET